MTDEIEAIANMLSELDVTSGDPPEKGDSLPDSDPLTRIEALLEKIEELQKENTAVRTELQRKKILENLQTICRELKVPESVILHDLQYHLPDFVLTKEGKVVLAADHFQSAKDVLAALQKQKAHWQPRTAGVGSEPLTPHEKDCNWFTTSR